MRSRTLTPLLLVLFLSGPVTPSPAAQQRFELRGEVLIADNEPLPGPRTFRVGLHGHSNTFTENKVAMGGKFKFGKLQPGTYTLAVNARSFGETRQTVEIGKSFADERGRIGVRILLRRPATREGAGYTVSARALSIPYSAWSEYQRGLKELGRHKEESAIAHLEKAIQKAPRFVEALNHLGTIYYRRKEFAAAEKYFREGLEIDGNAYEPLVNLGGTLISMERFGEALPLNRNAVLARPDDPLAQAQLGINLFALGHFDQAIPYLNRAKELDPAHFTHPQMTLAEIYFRKGDRKAAFAELQEFVKFHPDDPNADRIRKALQ